MLKRRLYGHVYKLACEFGPRNLEHLAALDKTREYIQQQMSHYNNNLSTHDYLVTHTLIQNLIAEQTGHQYPDEIIVIGAHYDTVKDSPGADDNASGVAGMLELIRLMKFYENQRTLRFIAFNLEEPPFFGTEEMGSHRYANHCKALNENIVAMISLEMLGFYTEKRGTQKYPGAGMIGRYDTRGNFIAVVGNNQSRELGNFVARKLDEMALIKTKEMIHPTPVFGSDLSDHSSFWKHNYPAIMITDTAFYRNPHYHETSDTIDKLNFRYFARLVYSLAYMIQQLDAEQSLTK
ncbi:MAG: M28 family peptidase [candidate division KSB1 bacterium]|nr:M28 family peptidase [candidate division KSB1 bacterium]MDZ7398754.1 M28 family peptidase [candidate division KSB1 bacterium]